MTAKIGCPICKHNRNVLTTLVVAILLNSMKTPTVLLPVIVLGNVLLSANIASAQTYQPSGRVPIADNTLGTQVSGNNNNLTITGGINRGQNLFHSFQDFSVPINGAVVFVNPVGNQSIITRVTGNLFSDINGNINTQGANFLLINPNGIVFGPNTQLNVGRVFAASTANGIDLVDGSGRMISFGTNSNGDAPLLTIDPNVLFNISRLNLGGGNGEIKNFGVLQTNNPNQYIGLIGGNVTINGGQINAPGGKVELGGLSAPGKVEFSPAGTNNSTNFPVGVSRSNVSLINQSTVNVAGAGNGNIVVTARQIELSGDSLIRGGIERGLGTPEAVAGDIRLNATDTIAIYSNSAVLNNVRANSQGKGGNIIIDANTLIIRDDGSAIQAATYGRGDGGDIRVSIASNIDITGQFSGINTLVGTDAIGNGGNITINTGFLFLQNGALLSAVTSGRGNAGNIKINAQKTVALVAADITSTMEGVGNAGRITIDTNSLILSNGATLSASTFGLGNAGNVVVNAQNAVTLTDKNTSIFTKVESGAIGTGGNIAIDAQSVSLTDGAQLIAANTGTGDAGNVIVKATETVSLIGNNTTIFSTIEAGGVGKGGNISIDANVVELGNGAQLRALTRGTGAAGNVRIAAKQAVTLTGARTAIIDTVEPGGVGKSGNISIDAGTVLLTNGSFLTSSNNGTGDAGNINVKAAGAVNIVGIKSNNNNLTGGISSLVGSKVVGNGGNITIDARSLLLQDSAALLAGNLGQGNAGKIEITAADAVLLSGTGGLFVTTGSPKGTGGDIAIASPQVTLDNGSRINAGSISGNGGNIKIGNQTTDLLLLRRGVSIATNASGTPQQGGNGGNININAQFIIAVPQENSDISANAVKGSGGNVNITSQGLFGIQFRPQPTSNSDITVSSDLGQSGNIIINTPGIDPGKDISKLPTVPTDASKQVAQTCNPTQRGSKLYITGRGGHPPTADNPIANDVVWLDSRIPNLPPVVSNSIVQSLQKPPQPAVNWVFDGKGKVTMISASTEGETTKTKVVCPSQ
jgi:filamentous hemagglutinin family protein